jgi:hypothetical protein
MQGEDNKTVKIGLTGGDVGRRRKGLQTGHDSLLRVLHTMPGGRTEETALHERFERYRVPGTVEWFFTSTDIRDWLATLIEHKAEAADETALEWLARIGSKESDMAIREWNRLRGTLDTVGGWTLWDILAGARKGVAEPLFKQNTIRRKADKVCYFFPIFVEACQRQGIVPPAGAIVAGIRPMSHRKPQPGRWIGKSLRGYPK